MVAIRENKYARLDFDEFGDAFAYRIFIKKDGRHTRTAFMNKKDALRNFQYATAVARHGKKLKRLI